MWGISIFFCTFAVANVKTRVTRSTAAQLRYVLRYALPTANASLVYVGDPIKEEITLLCKRL